jgi:transcriptional regulator with XRE-family HTH domain
MVNTSLGTTLRSLREQADLSQEELAARAQVSRASVQNWERDRSTPRRAEFRRLATALGITADHLRALTEQPEPAAAPDEIRRLIAEAEDELRWLDPKYESTRKIIAARLQAEIDALRAQLKAVVESDTAQ